MTASYALPASFAQEVLWYLDRATPGLTAYNVSRARHLRGPFDHEAFRHALDALVERHEILRTTYREHDGKIEQVVGPVRAADLRIVDLASLPADQRGAAAVREVEAASAMPFDLVNGPMLRVRLVRIDADEHVLLIATHHIASDGWSGAIMFRELFALYRGFERGVPAELPDLPIQYGDFAAWQRERFHGERLEELLQFWRTQLDGQLPVLQLPTDHPRSLLPGFEGAGTGATLSPSLASGLRALGQRHGATLYMVLLAAYQAVLARWSGQDDVIVGSPIVGRDRSETEGLIGYFANTLVLRAQFGDNPTFETLLARVRETALGAYDHEEIPLEKLVVDLQRDGRIRDTALFRVVFTMLDDTARAEQAGELAIQPANVKIDSVKFDFTLFLSDRSNETGLRLFYRTELFEAATARRFIDQLVAFLEAVVAQPTRRVLDVPVLSDAERAQLESWQGPARTLDPTPVPSLIAARARQASDAVAVVHGDVTISYGALQSRATSLARALRAAGAEHGSVVGLLLDRGVDLLTSVQGIWLAGGAYVPLVPDLPTARLEALVRESGAQFVVTSSALRDRVPRGATPVLVDAVFTSPSDDSALPSVSADGLAYVLFTSGSTGVPKGIGVTHADLSHYVQAISARLGLALDGSAPWSGASVSTLAADLGHTSTFPILCAGGVLHLVPDAVSMEPTRWADYTSGHPIDLLKITPSHLKALVGDAAGDELAKLLPRRWLVVGGEACPVSLADAVRAAGACRLMNHYGPTETTVGVCTFAPDEEESPKESVGSLPIGRPLANMRAEVRDARGNEVAIGIHGELWIAGPQVSRGYLGRDDLTAERFVEDAAGVRWYRTGDRVRRLGTGVLEFLGRLDAQVKVRGFRVELEEIERVLCAVPGVSQAAVTLRDDAIAAYVVAAAGVTDAVLVAASAAWLPDYMIPAVWTRVDRLPLNANGKLDRTALAMLERSPQDESRGDTTPRGETEERLASLWAEVLKKDAIGRDDDFFALGGHSLLAIRVLGRISKSFGVRLSLRTLFDHPTVSRLAPRLELEAQLEALEGMSEAEAERLLATELRAEPSS